MIEATQALKPHVVYLKDYERPDFTIKKIDLTFELGEPLTLVKSKMNIQRLSNDAKDLVLQGEKLTLDSVSLNNEFLNESQFRVTDAQLIIFDVPNQFELEVVTQLKPQDNTQLSGLYRSGPTFVTQCEAEGFRHITYFLDRPDVLTKYTTTVVADQTNYPHLLSNGNLIERGILPNNQHWVKWEDPFKKPSYLFALVAGDFDLLEDYFITQTGRRIILRIYTEKGYKDQCTHAMQAVKKAMRWDEENYGREYDLDIFMIVAINDFNSGAMENKGLNIFNTKYVLYKPETATDEDFIHIEAVVAHEYFHNWTGDRITCRDWFQLSLKEGLTVFRDQSFTADTTSRGVARIHQVNALRNRQFPEDAGPLAHPVRPDSYMEISNFYTTTIYEKGAEVIRMMQTILGATLFRRGMDLYFTRHDGQAVTIEDFVRAMEDASGVDLTQFRLWYTQSGTPIVTATANYDADKKLYTMTFKQVCPPTPGQQEKKPMHIPIRMGLLDEEGHVMQLDTGDDKSTAQKVLHLKSETETIQFKNISSQPVPSLLRNFSAPIKLIFDYSDEDLAHLVKYDTDEFNRWEAGQLYAQRVILNLINDDQNKKVLKVPDKFVALYRSLLENQEINSQLLAEMLVLPSEIYIAEQMPVVDVEAIHHVRERVRSTLATELQDLFLTRYNQNQTHNDIGDRQLKNLCLSYLMLLPMGDPRKNIGLKQFSESLRHNMTDTMAILRALVNIPGKERAIALDEFYKTWRHVPLIIDKWFAVQAASTLPNTLDEIQKLLQHEAFDLKNPNKVYALIGTFGHNNLVNFHRADGAGYQFLAQFVLKLDKLNTNVAARMMKPLTEWRRFDSQRQALMCAQLEIMIRTPGISNDIYELVSKALAQS